MIIRIAILFILFAGLAYYFNIDVRNIVDKSGAPAWLASHGIATSSTASASSFNTSEATTTTSE